MNKYTQAVKFIQDYVDATNTVFEEGTLPGIESGLEYALKILREQPEYDGQFTTQ